MKKVPHDAIILAGGEGQRLGGQDKAVLEVGRRTLLSWVSEAAAQAETVVVAGPVRPGFPQVRWTREKPPGGGPSAGIVAGLKALDRVDAPPWVLVLAVDQPGAPAVVNQILNVAAQTSTDSDVVCPQDNSGQNQWLLGAYRRRPLRRACSRVGTGHEVSVRQLVAELRAVDVPGVDTHLGDVDTWEDLDNWQNCS